ncbi:exopolyphosphatase/guanosine-5'-triphosphate,3'-diphosphate pyrophosphatase [Sphingobacterium alimentarium]|uniref:Exopolyphosphatase/guanosine-5'-triphosphate, 3'-diphosphate pyrophosphatase n=1 Tax=Sphingobacterium alimentarium TaxID=797292 RepID=A0A4R3VZ88_9SPHI|nr:exopolyphosphatase [Sphingobacterium alimentarium]TCV17184.1 exopolyphosphatase/guanosine-5'-triphosphate,3'-diphosphate pyrophosphatase [Sphingobacterium alimentarium]
MRFAAIDIGSNAIRLLIADILCKDSKVFYTKNTLLRVPLRLGDDAFLNKKISPPKFEDMVKTMRAFKDLLDVYKVSDYKACATSAMRDSENGVQVVNACKEVGIDINIIDGGDEAKIIYNAYLSGIMDKDKVYLYIDVGGGSTEISLFANGALKGSKSFNLGTIRILDKQDTPEIWQEMREWVKDITKDYKEIYGIGTGGNINKLSRMINNGQDKPFTYARLASVYDHLSSFTMDQRIHELGLRSDRADVIIPAAEIFMTIMKTGHLRNIVAPRVGLVDGIIQQLILRNYNKILSQ